MTWQTIVTGLLIIGAAIYLTRKWWPRPKSADAAGKDGCGCGCDGCPTKNIKSPTCRP